MSEVSVDIATRSVDVVRAIGDGGGAGAVTLRVALRVRAIHVPDNRDPHPRPGIDIEQLHTAACGTAVLYPP